MILLYIYTVCSLMAWAVLVDDSIKKDYDFAKPFFQWTIGQFVSNFALVFLLLPCLAIFWPVGIYFVAQRILNGE